MKKYTIKEIAQLAGVSPTAVSFVINSKKGVSDETRQKVKAIIEKTNFKSSMSSRRLLSKKSYNICLMLNAASSPFESLFYFEIARGILEKSRKHGYNLVINEIRIAKGGANRLPDVVYSDDADGIIFFQDVDRDVLAEVNQTDIPYLVIDSHIFDDDFISINPDYQVAAYTAAKYLIGTGHKNIAFIASNRTPSFYMQTFSGYKRAMDENGLPVFESYIKNTANDEDSAYLCMDDILNAANERPTAVLCTADIFAIGAMRCVSDKGLNIPGDISFIGIDDIVLSKYVVPKLTTVQIDKVEMGRMAMELLVKMIRGEKVTSVVIPSDRLVIRDSAKQ